MFWFRNNGRCVLGCLAGIALGLAGLAPAMAAALNFDPILLDFAQGQTAATLSITNRGLDATTVQIRAFGWAQDADADPLTPTGDVILSPPEAAIPAGQTQVVRLLLRAPAGGAEQHYRLLVDQIGSPAGGGIAIALHVSLPVIVDGAVTQAAALQWRVESAAGRRLMLAAYNPGSRFLRISFVAAQLPGGVKVAAKMAGDTPFVLPGQTRHWYVEVPALAPSAGQLLVTAHFGERTQATSIPYGF